MYGTISMSAIAAWGHELLVLVVFAGVCAGQAALIFGAMNWFYSFPLPRRFLRIVRHFCELTIVSIPFVWWWCCGFEVFRFAQNVAAPGVSWGMQIFLGLTLAAGVVFFPLATIRRSLRRPPRALLSNDTYTLDVAKHLGYRPVGHGKHRRLAQLPFNQIFQVDFSVRTLCVPQLPAAWDGLTILHVSDLHMCGTPDRAFYDQVMDRCRDWDPDIVAVTGDIIDSSRHHRWITPVLGRLRWRIAGFAILGNHDYYRDPPLIRRRLRQLGMRVVGNTWAEVEVRGQPMVVIGHEGPWFRPGPKMAHCPEGVFRLCLSHTPDHIQWARRHAVDLMLAGHVHGGQIRLPLIGSLFVPSRYGRRYDCGTFHEPPTLLHVSRGLAGQHPLRFNCRPEVTKIVLRAAVSVEKPIEHVEVA